MWFFDFVRVSYQFINPRGLREWFWFLSNLPFVAVIYRNVMKEYRRSLK